MPALSAVSTTPVLHINNTSATSTIFIILKTTFLRGDVKKIIGTGCRENIDRLEV